MNPRRWAVRVVGVLCLGLLAAAVPSAAAATVPGAPIRGWYTYQSAANARCLTETPPPPGNTFYTTVTPCDPRNPSNPQKWYHQDHDAVGEHRVIIKSGASGGCVDITFPNPVGALPTTPCDEDFHTDSQEFIVGAHRFPGDPKTYYSFASAQLWSQCLDVDAAGRVGLRECTRFANQLFY